MRITKRFGEETRSFATLHLYPFNRLRSLGNESYKFHLSHEYKPKQKVKFATLELTKPIDNIRERFKVLLGGKDKAGEFYRDSFYGIFEYVSNRIPEIADELFKIDDAVCAGFGWEVGPFDTWDQIGVSKSLA